MKEIVRVKNDHRVLSVRIPTDHCRARGIKRGDYMIWEHNRKGDLTLRTFDEGLNNDNENEKC